MKANYIPYLLIGAWLMAMPPVYAQQAPDLKQQLPGSWEGEGTLFGRAATFSMEWESTLNDKFLSLTFLNRFTDAGGTERQMQARAYYNLATLEGYWFDSRGQTLPLTFEIAENTLTVLWGDEASSERGKTVYSINPPGVDVEDYVYRQDGYVQFGTARYLKKE